MTNGNELDLNITTFSAANGFLQAVNLDGTRRASDSQGSILDENNKTIINGTELVTGLGQSALVVFQTSVNPPPDGTISHKVIMLATAANAEIEIDITYFANSPPRSVQLRAVIAVTRDILADLPRS